MQVNDGVCFKVSSFFLSYFDITMKWLAIVLEGVLFPNAGCVVHSEFDGIVLDYSRQQATVHTVDKLYNLAEVKLGSFFVGCSGILT